MCGRRHATVLHEALSQPKHNRAPDDDQAPHSNVPTVGANVFSGANSNHDHVYLQILPVKVHSPDGLCIDTFAMLDTGSQATLVRKTVADRLGLRGPEFDLNLGHISGVAQARKSQRVRFAMSDPCDRNKPEIQVSEAWVFDSDFGLPAQIIPRDERGWPQWSHISDLNIPNVISEEIGILIGSNCKPCFREIEIRPGSAAVPDCVPTPLGWSLRGSGTPDGSDNM